MKSLIIAASAAAACFTLPALAQAQTAPEVYGTLGYAQGSSGGVDLGAVQGRVGARWHYFGVEGELAGGVKSDTTTVGATNVKVKLNDEEAVYGVGFLPVSPNFDLFARVGYGETNTKASSGALTADGSGHSWNYGVGGQYFFTPKDGLRIDYTRQDFTQSGSKDANVWGASYVRKF